MYQYPSRPGVQPMQVSGREQPSKLFIYNLAKCVTDRDLWPLFAPYNPEYATVALGKKGSSRVRSRGVQCRSG